MEPDPRAADFSADMGPLDELEFVELQVEHAAMDEEQTMFDPDTHPTAPCAKEEGVTDVDGEKNVDVMRDTPPIDDLSLDVPDVGVDSVSGVGLD